MRHSSQVSETLPTPGVVPRHALTIVSRATRARVLAGMFVATVSATLVAQSGPAAPHAGPAIGSAAGSRVENHSHLQRLMLPGSARSEAAAHWGPDLVFLDPSTPTQIPPMMPYVAIHNPAFVQASNAAFALDDDLVIGVAHGTTAKAYLAVDLAQHGSVDDQMPDGPIEVTWCSTCGTGAVFRAVLNGRRLHFEYDSMVNANEVHKDVETGSRWQQSTGEAISGPLKGSRLELYPFILTTWHAWRARYPKTTLLEPLPGYLDRFPILRARAKQARTSGEGMAPDGSFSKDDRLRPREMIAGLAVGSDTIAFPLAALRVTRVVNERVGGVPVVVIYQPSSDTTTAFEARAKDRVLRFEAANAEASSLIDLDTHSTWDAYGRSVDGPLKGTQLKPLILIPEFWFAWSQFRPATRVFVAKTAAER
jgi:hypothetical protein